MVQNYIDAYTPKKLWLKCCQQTNSLLVKTVSGHVEAWPEAWPLAHAELGLEAKRSAVSIWRFLHAWPLPDWFAKCFV
jgi:hypothetical protein